MKYLLILILTLGSLASQAQQLHTTFPEDFNRWKFEGENFNTVFHDGFDRWTYDRLTIQTVFMNDWNNWKIGSDVRLKTAFTNSFNHWKIEGLGQSVSVQTTFHGNYTQWNITGDVEGSFRCVFINDWERWEFDLSFDEVSKEIRAALLFIAIHTSIKKH